MIESVKILTVDDEPLNLEMLDYMLSSLEPVIHKAGDGKACLEQLELHPDTDIILLDLQMPVLNGFEILPMLRTDDRYRNIPVIVITASRDEVLRALSLGASDFLSKPYNPEELKLRVMNHVRSKKLFDLSRDMEQVMVQEVVKKTAQLQRALEFSKQTEYEITLRLGKAAEFRDMETGMHIKRISEFSWLLGQLAGLPEKACEILRYASPLHDVGKIGIPDNILLKPGKLEAPEFEIMKMHTLIGGKILSDSRKYPMIAAGQIIALQHHEKWDGSGYPYGLSGTRIHIFSRIVMVVDIFDALLSDRPYKKAFTLDEALAIIQDGAGSFFEPRLVALFVENLDRFTTMRETLHEPVADSPLTQLFLS